MDLLQVLENRYNIPKIKNTVYSVKPGEKTPRRIPGWLERSKVVGVVAPACIGIKICQEMTSLYEDHTRGIPASSKQ